MKKLVLIIGASCTFSVFLSARYVSEIIINAARVSLRNQWNVLTNNGAKSFAHMGELERRTSEEVREAYRLQSMHNFWSILEETCLNYEVFTLSAQDIQAAELRAKKLVELFVTRERDLLFTRYCMLVHWDFCKKYPVVTPSSGFDEGFEKFLKFYELMAPPAVRQHLKATKKLLEGFEKIALKLVENFTENAC